MPEISVIVPVYNAKKYLNRCIDSILGQTFEDFELILINDGSKDGSGTICDEYAKKDSRIKVIHKQNGGVSAARNDGLDMACGKYIMFVDSDDYVDEKTLEILIEKMSDDADLIISSMRMYYDGDIYDFYIQNAVYTTKELLQNYCLKNYPPICFNGPWAKLYKKEIIENHAIRFDPSLNIGEDTDFNLQYINNIDNICCTDEILYYYIRDNSDSLFSKFRSYYYDDSRRVYEKTVAVAKKYGVEGAALSEFTKRHLGTFITNILKAYRSVDKNECLDYMINVSKDRCFLENISLLSDSKVQYFIALLLKFRLYGLIYFVISLKYKK